MQKESRVRAVVNTAQQPELDPEMFMHRIERWLERSGHEERRYMKNGSSGGTSPLDRVLTLMMLSRGMGGQQTSVTVNVDSIVTGTYAECDRCDERDMCKGAYPKLLEYVTSRVG